MNSFDLIDSQQTVRETLCPKTLFEAWEIVSRKYLMREVTKYDLEEMRAVVWEQFRLICRAGQVKTALKEIGVERVNPRAAFAGNKVLKKAKTVCSCDVCSTDWHPRRGKIA